MIYRVFFGVNTAIGVTAYRHILRLRTRIPITLVFLGFAQCCIEVLFFKLFRRASPGESVPILFIGFSWFFHFSCFSRSQGVYVLIICMERFLYKATRWPGEHRKQPPRRRLWRSSWQLVWLVWNAAELIVTDFWRTMEYHQLESQLEYHWNISLEYQCTIRIP